MNKNTMIKNYRTMDASDSTIMGFVYKHGIYMVELPHIMPRYMTVEKESTSHGGALTLRLRLNNLYKEQLIRKGATYIGTDTEIYALAKNKGHAFERYVTEQVAGQHWEADNIPFYVQGDVNINGKEVQVKFEGATITTERTLRNARLTLRAA